jgi:hypothetical protein
MRLQGHCRQAGDYQTFQLNAIFQPSRFILYASCPGHPAIPSNAKKVPG